MLDRSNTLVDQVAHSQDIDPAEPERGVIQDMLTTGILFGIIAGFITFLLVPDTLMIPSAAALVGTAFGAVLGWDKPGTRGETRRPHSRTHLTL